VLRGVALSLVAGLLPPLVYVLLLYWVDQYEKEPVRLLAAALLWGAVPAALAAVVMRIFFRLPASLLGPGAIRLVSSGLVTPLIEEALIGAAVLFIAWRYRHEFDDALDGIIYGAVAGLGFAMTANIASYLGTFLQYGFAGLGQKVYVEGFLYGLDQALYAAIFGAGVGYARLAWRRLERWAVPVAAFALAVATRACHNLASENATGGNLWTLAVTWAGFLVILAVILWSLEQERRCLAAELAGEVPDTLYRRITAPAGCWLAEWHALRRGGWQGLVRVRHTLQQCTRLAFIKSQSRQPGEPGAAGELHQLRQRMAGALDGALLELVS
jgi:RsiW-degrading membrane proteinase PrsW (M82 family)